MAGIIFQLAYAPQLGTRLHLNHTILNLIGLMQSCTYHLSSCSSFELTFPKSTVGTSTSGPYWGYIVDARGPRILLACAFFLLFTAYSGTRYIFDIGSQVDKAPTGIVILLIVFAYMIGAGGHAGLTSGINATAKTFPDKAVRRKSLFCVEIFC